MSGVEVSPWPWLVANVIECVVIVWWLVLDVRRELRELSR